MTDARDGSGTRIVSLIASATEIVHALGAGGSLVGRSHECDWPTTVLQLPALTRARFKLGGGSGAIDRAVKDLVEGGLAVYDVNAALLRDLAPDVILTQDQCEVCAVSLGDVERAVAEWTGCAATVVSLRPHTISDVLSDNLRIANAIGTSDAGLALNQSMLSRLTETSSRVAGRPRRRLAFIEWIDPLMSCGHWMPELVTIAGGISLFGETGAQSPWIDMEALVAADPDVILVAPCGFDIATSAAEMGHLDNDPRWRGMRAVASGQVFIADGNAFFNRPGPRLVESAEILAEILHPDGSTSKHLDVTVVRHVAGGRAGPISAS